MGSTYCPVPCTCLKRKKKLQYTSISQGLKATTEKNKWETIPEGPAASQSWEAHDLVRHDIVLVACHKTLGNVPVACHKTLGNELCIGNGTLQWSNCIIFIVTLHFFFNSEYLFYQKHRWEWGMECWPVISYAIKQYR